MEELFVPFNIAKILKEKGFDEYCLAIFDNEGFRLTTEPLKNSYLEGHWRCTYPLYQQVVDWLDNKGFNINISSEYYYDGVNWLWQIFWLNPISKWEKNVKDQYIRESIYEGTYLYGDNHEYPTRNDALLAAIKYVLTEKLTQL